MATDKLFTVAGVSTLNSETKVRFANDELRVKVLMKHGHTDLILIALPEPMTKLDAVKFIKGLDEFQGAAAQAAISDYLDRKDEKPAKAKAEKTAKPAKAPAKAKTAAVKAPVDLSDAEDALL